MKIFIFRGMTSCSVSIECHVNTKLRLLAKIIGVEYVCMIIILFATNHCNQPASDEKGTLNPRRMENEFFFSCLAELRNQGHVGENV